MLLALYGASSLRQIYHLAQVFAHFKMQNPLGRYVHLFAGLGVSGFSGGAVFEPEVAETPYFDLFAPAQGVRDALEKYVYDYLRLRLRKALRFIGNHVYKLGLRHVFPVSFLSRIPFYRVALILAQPFLSDSLFYRISLFLRYPFLSRIPYSCAALFLR
jgi:hypothetical protein